MVALRRGCSQIISGDIDSKMLVGGLPGVPVAGLPSAV